MLRVALRNHLGALQTTPPSLQTRLLRPALTSAHSLRPTPAAQRLLHSSPLRRADWNSPRQPRYTRFGESSSGGGGGGDPGWHNSRLFRQMGDPRTRLIVGTVVLGGGAYYVYHLEKVEESGRWRFIDISRESERQMGLDTFKQMMNEYGTKVLPAAHPTSRFVQDVAEQILTSAGLGHVKGRSGLREKAVDAFGSLWGGAEEAHDIASSIAGSNEEWEVFVIKDDSTRNAFVLPGGKIFVFTGILPVTKNADGLASVLGHEIAHQVARHAGERISSTKVLFALVTILELLGLDVGISRIGLTLLMALPNSRTQEAEADLIGLRLMSKACYNPQEAAQMWVRMQQQENEETKSSGGWLSSVFGGSAGDVDFLSTHPASGKRVKALESQVPEALAIRAASPSCTHQGQFDDFRYAMGDGNSSATFGRW